MTEFSVHTRRANVEKLSAEMFDILIVGGGIIGAAIARDAAIASFPQAFSLSQFS